MNKNRLLARISKVGHAVVPRNLAKDLKESSKLASPQPGLSFQDLEEVIHAIGECRAKVLIIGNSHTLCLPRDVSERTNDTVRVVTVQKAEYAHLFKAGVPTTDLRDFYDPTHVFSILGGNRHYNVGLVEHEHKMQVLADADDMLLAPDRTLISNAMMRDLMLEMTRDPLFMMKNIRGFYSCPITHVMSPPPIDLEDISDKLDRAMQQLGDFTATPPLHRLRCYRIFCSVMREFCRREGFEVLDPPEEAVSPEGFLREEYHGPNATHANGRYGYLILRNILQSVVTS